MDMAYNAGVRRTTRSIWATAVFLCGFVILLAVLAHYVLLPGWRTANQLGGTQKTLMSAYAALLLALLLALLWVGLIIVLRLRQSFVNPSGKRVKTKYVDAWAEAGKRELQGLRSIGGAGAGIIHRHVIGDRIRQVEVLVWLR